jgi:LytR cell envelope-related transcriptional attenuator
MTTTRQPVHDDRYAAPSEASRRGAHRARTKPLSTGLPVLAGIAVVLLVIGGVYMVIGNNQSVSSDSSVAAAPTSAESIPANAATTAPAQASAQPTTTPSTTTSTTTSATDTGVHKTVSLIVLNSIAVKGLAARVQTKVEADGWNVGRTGNSINKGLTTTKIYYGRKSLRATAQALRSDLGFGQTFRDTGVTTKGIVVVLGHDAENA